MYHKHTHGDNWDELSHYAEEIIKALKDADPNFIMEQIIRIDFYRNPFMGCEGWPLSKFLLNEVEGFESQIVCNNSNDPQNGESRLHGYTKGYYERIFKVLVFFELNLRQKSKWITYLADAYEDLQNFLLEIFNK